MLNIRIAGSEFELRQVSEHLGHANIRPFQRKNGKTTYILDLQIEVDELLNNTNLSNQKSTRYGKDSGQCNALEIQAELEDLLNEISDE